VVALIGAAVATRFTVDTAQRSLEAVSP
jgi:hypothetical protein